MYGGMLEDKYEIQYEWEDFNFIIDGLKKHGIMTNEILFDVTWNVDKIATYIENYLKDEKVQYDIPRSRRELRQYIRHNFEKLYERYYNRIKKEPEIIDLGERNAYAILLSYVKYEDLVNIKKDIIKTPSVEDMKDSIATDEFNPEKQLGVALNIIENAGVLVYEDKVIL